MQPIARWNSRNTFIQYNFKYDHNTLSFVQQCNQKWGITVKSSSKLRSLNVHRSSRPHATWWKNRSTQLYQLRTTVFPPITVQAWVCKAVDRKGSPIRITCRYSTNISTNTAHFWLLSGRSTVRYVIQKCITCFKAKPTEHQPLMRY